ncbi:S-adenosyl-L-methionine-dependent methyltransferase [Lenzites betulinus]|nr:S-adenosyl-L-methionine-dependent methyltransferase [Lenzites betulinus]
MSASSPNESRIEEFNKMRKHIADDPNNGWENAWQAGVTPWDAGQVQLALKELVETSGLDLPRSGRALVPGCGRGYDAIYIASTLGLETTGADISPLAVAKAQAYKDSAAASVDNVKFEVIDFFAAEGATYDLIYDYTFFVAIPPSMRPAWGKQMSKLVKPGGFLITLVYPIVPQTDIGPPFFVRPEHYDEVLGEGWAKVWDQVPEKTLETHVGKERMVVRKKLA